MSSKFDSLAKFFSKTIVKKISFSFFKGSKRGFRFQKLLFFPKAKRSFLEKTKTERNTFFRSFLKTNNPTCKIQHVLFVKYYTTGFVCN